MKKISVIVPCHNVAQYLDVCMHHLLTQTIGLEQMEIILVDDASADDGATLAKLKEYESKYPQQIVLIPLDENKGAGGARNVGLTYASGEYTAYCDPDDWICPDGLRRAYSAAKEYDCDVVEFGYQRVRSYDAGWAEEAAAGEKGRLLEIKGDEMRRALLVDSSRTIMCCNKLYRTKMLQDNDIRFTEHVVYEEARFSHMICLYEKRRCYLPDTIYFYLQRPGSATHTGSAEDRKFDLIRSYGGLVWDAKQRGKWEDYREELEFLYWLMGFHTTLRYAAKNHFFFTNVEFAWLQRQAREVIPDIRSNRYFKEHQAIPVLADVVYCDGMRVNMQELYEIYQVL